jgi:hypothetical protein
MVNEQDLKQGETETEGVIATHPFEMVVFVLEDDSRDTKELNQLWRSVQILILYSNVTRPRDIPTNSREGETSFDVAQCQRRLPKNLNEGIVRFA